MKAIIMFALLAVAAAEKFERTYAAPDSPEYEIIKDDRVYPDEHGRYSLDLETEDGVARQESGNEDGSQQGSYSYTAPDGTEVYVKFVANENGYQPESPFLPVAPEFPHPIPQFVLDQIEFAAQEDAARARGESRSYSAPDK
ncbi:cuticle protein AM1199-like [Panulirus ornatus]|uniref:cuticle protein AM1199-like n=1 Tax=Panulirus ornatus TaxID=150431 RepID=UPI003A8BB612